MSSKVHAWRTPVIEPSVVKMSSLAAVTQTCGCACAAPPPKASAAEIDSRGSKLRSKTSTPAAPAPQRRCWGAISYLFREAEEEAAARSELRREHTYAGPAPDFVDVVEQVDDV